MKSVKIFAALALGLAATSAYAADMPFGGPAAPVAPVFVATSSGPWAGFYAGVNLGGAYVHDSDISVNWIGSGMVDPFPAAIDDRKNNGFLGGAQVGYNFQMGGFVAGVEADLQYADIRNRFSGAHSFDRTLPGGTLSQNYDFALQSELEWFGTARVRLGYAVAPQLLVYGTGGLAFGEIKTSGTAVDTFVTTSGGRTVTEVDTYSVRKSKTETGYTLGAGLEYAFNRNLSLKGEYLYLNLPETDTVLVSDDATADTYVAKHKNDLSIFRAGVNYKF
ncbi:outer membrane protein [Microvirga tunisiensis]|nr:outer membrane beta-barrel protein [Microvirga tunisiensis]